MHINILRIIIIITTGPSLYLTWDSKSSVNGFVIQGYTSNWCFNFTGNFLSLVNIDTTADKLPPALSPPTAILLQSPPKFDALL